ncbi:MAG: SpoIIE family protein phosphatase [Ruminococcus sp.]|uniref:SpoIIE family protein phosphatase n=1 Tax=Ruminococcus sp. TaxID=41978 RepID=UPI0028739BF1|nr:SpoIIE family protein phosphatase [Ruminococcus sp.]MBQ3285857.1 SpoIIE family protein phosphatase [Ruminococcus sp.]
MPKKSIREMSNLEKKHYSLEAKTFRSTIMGALILGLAALIIGLGIYTYTLVHQYITEAFNLSKSAAAILQEVVDVEPLADGVMTDYHAMSDSEREQTGTDAYRARFSDYTKREDYQKIRDVFDKFANAVDVDDVYLAMYDRNTDALVYMADHDDDPETCVYPLDWDAVSEKEIAKFLNWDGEGEVYHIEKTENYGWLCTSGVPIKNDMGQTVAFVLSDISLANVANGMKGFFGSYFLCMVILVIIVAILMAKHMKKTLATPINRVAQTAEEYVRDRRSGDKNTEHFAKLNIRTGDEIENLSLIMADMERDLKEHEENLTKVTAEKERISTELSLATRIQSAMLPSIYPAFPERSEFDIYASMDPAKEVGGDFYDFFLVDDDHLCTVIADVSGKGIPAALFMMASRIIIANNAKMGKSPAQILTDTNAAICANNKEEMFVTVWVGILELSTGKLTAANAGHEFPTLKPANGKFMLYKDKHGFVIGGMDGIRYKEYEIQLQPGAKVFLYTDGVPEATDAEGELFGTERMLDALNGDPNAKPELILKNVRGAVDAFVKDAEQFDDLTMLCVEYRGNADPDADQTGAET